MNVSAISHFFPGTRLGGGVLQGERQFDKGRRLIRNHIGIRPTHHVRQGPRAVFRRWWWWRRRQRLAVGLAAVDIDERTVTAGDEGHQGVGYRFLDRRQ